MLRRAHAEGKAAFGLRLRFADFAAEARARLAARLARAGLPTDEPHLTHLAHSSFTRDLFLAIACERGVRRSWDRLIEEYAARLRSLATSHGARVGEATEVVDDLPGYLVTPERDGRSYLAGYLGTGSLFSWLGTIVLRRIARRRRREASQHGVSLTVLREPLTDEPASDRLAAAAEQCRSFGDVVGEVLAALPLRERLALRYRFADELDLRAIARLFAVGVPRASRIVAAAVDHLRQGVGERLGDRSLAEIEGAMAGMRDELSTRLRAVQAG